MSNKIRIHTDAGSPALGTYSQAIRTGDLVFVTGQTGRDSETGKLEGGLEAQTRQVLANIDAILDAAGCTNANIVKVTLLLADIKDFKTFDQIYAALNVEQKLSIDQQVANHIQLYGMETQEMDCSRLARTGSRKITVNCRKAFDARMPPRE